MTDIERLKELNIPKNCEMYGTIQRAIKALEIVNEFENTRMIIGGRLQGNSMAYKKGLEDGKRKALEQEPCREQDDYENEIEDLHNRLDIAEYDKERLREEVTRLEEKIKALEQEPKTDYKSFCEWVASEIFSENWEYNKDSFAEIACRKLNKLGIVASEGDAWKLKESEG